MKKESRFSPVLMALAVILLYVLNTAFITPLIANIIESADAASQVIAVLSYFSYLLPIIATFIGYAYIVRSVLRTSVKGSLLYIILYQFSCFVGLIFSVAWEYIITGTLPEKDELSPAVLSLLTNFILISALAYAVVFLANLAKKKAPAAKIIPLSALLAAAVEGTKHLVIELGYIIPFLVEYASDIRPGEIISILISLIYVLFVFALGYILIDGFLKFKKK